jgi:hypothetical protein
VIEFFYTLGILWPDTCSERYASTATKQHKRLVMKTPETPDWWNELVQQKQSARAQDEDDLRSGKKTAAQLQQENSLFAKLSIEPDLRQWLQRRKR